jgi:hypothetical protein
LGAAEGEADGGAAARPRIGEPDASQEHSTCAAVGGDQFEVADESSQAPPIARG